MRLARLLYNYHPDSCTVVPVAGKPHLGGCWEALRRKVCVSAHAGSFSETETKLRGPPQSLTLLLLDGGAECRLAQGWMANKAKITSSTQPSFFLISFLSLNAHMPLPLILFFLRYFFGCRPFVKSLLNLLQYCFYFMYWFMALRLMGS